MMKPCAHDGCTSRFEAKGAGKFCLTHRGQPKEKKAATASDPSAELVVPIEFSAKQLDRFWAGCTIEEKGLAVQTILEQQRCEE